MQEWSTITTRLFTKQLLYLGFVSVFIGGIFGQGAVMQTGYFQVVLLMVPSVFFFKLLFCNLLA